METSVNSSILRKLPRLALGSASLLAALYVGLSPRVAQNLYLRRLFRPYPFPEGSWDIREIGGIERQDCWFRAVDGSRLHGWLFEVPGAERVILFSHGNTGNITGRLSGIAQMLRAGASVFIYDFRGYGRSKGRPSVRGICEDGVMAFDYLLKERNYRPSQIVLYGESLGTAVAADTAAQRPCAGIILQSGFTSLRSIGIKAMPLTKIYPNFMFPSPRLDSAQLMERNKRPLLVIHGVKDAVVPFSHGEELFLRATEPKTFVTLPECAHSDICAVAPDKYMQAIRDFLQSLPTERA